MFTGNIEVKCEDTALTINATYWTDLEIDYSEIETIKYRKNLDVGVRTSGFGSPKLSMGIFQNDPIPSYRKERKIGNFVKNIHFTGFILFLSIRF